MTEAEFACLDDLAGAVRSGIPIARTRLGHLVCLVAGSASAGDRWAIRWDPAEQDYAWCVLRPSGTIAAMGSAGTLRAAVEAADARFAAIAAT